MATDFLELSDLQAKAGVKTVLGLFDDDNDDQIIATDLTRAITIMEQAENEAYSRLMRAYSKEQIILLANNDPALKGHIAWVALAFAAERRGEFIGDDGRSAYDRQYERAITYFELIAKGKARSAGETAAGGTTEQVGGVVQPTPESPTARFVFAPDNENPSGHGGF